MGNAHVFQMVCPRLCMIVLEKLLTQMLNVTLSNMIAPTTIDVMGSLPGHIVNAATIMASCPA